MSLHLHWKKKFFSKLHTIYYGDQEVCQIKLRSFRSTKVVVSNGVYSFKTKGLFKKRTKIVDSARNRIVGEIQYSLWKRKANIYIGTKKLSLYCDNMLVGRWILYDDNIEIKYLGSHTDGYIDSNKDDLLMITAGYFAIIYFRYRAQVGGS